MYETELLYIYRFCCCLSPIHTQLLLVTPTDRLKSVRNRCVIEVFGGVCVLSFGFRIFCWYRGFCHRTGSDLLLFLSMTMSEWQASYEYIFCNTKCVAESYRFPLYSPFCLRLIWDQKYDKFRNQDFSWWYSLGWKLYCKTICEHQCWIGLTLGLQRKSRSNMSEMTLQRRKIPSCIG